MSRSDRISGRPGSARSNAARRAAPVGSNAATFLALFCLVILSIGIVLLTAMVMPSLIAFPAILCGFVVFGSMHYALWGWWMTAAPADDEEDPF